MGVSKLLGSQPQVEPGASGPVLNESFVPGPRPSGRARRPYTAAFVELVSGAVGALTHATTQYITPDGVALADSYWAYGNKYQETQTVWGKQASTEASPSPSGGAQSGNASRARNPGGHGLAGGRVVLVPAGECGDHHTGVDDLHQRVRSSVSRTIAACG
jgi:hypothetical protein